MCDKYAVQYRIDTPRCHLNSYERGAPSVNVSMCAIIERGTQGSYSGQENNRAHETTLVRANTCQGQGQATRVSTTQYASASEAALATYRGIPIPVIPTTGPDTSVASPSPSHAGSHLASLHPPGGRKSRRRRRYGLDASSDSSDDDGESASDVYADASYSDASSIASRSASPSLLPRALLDQLRQSVAAETW